MVSPTDSKQPRKQRKARYEAPLHTRQKWLAVHMNKEMRGKLKTGRRSVPVREGDRVKIMRGEYRGKSGKVSRVDVRYCKVYVEGFVNWRNSVFHKLLNAPLLRVFSIPHIGFLINFHKRFHIIPQGLFLSPRQLF